jgi:lipopolysaccharide biosynthesis protein
MTIFRKIKSVWYWLIDSGKSANDFKKESIVKFCPIIPEDKKPASPAQLILTVHVYYEDFVSKLVSALEFYPQNTRVLVTTPSAEIKTSLEKKLTTMGFEHDVRVCPNRGRNFGPLLVEFSEQLRTSESFIHIHSKKTEHSLKISKEWLDRATSLFFDPSLLVRALTILDSSPSIGLVYADSSDLVWGINLRWGRSKRNLLKIISNYRGFENLRRRGRFSFPIGGMFMVRTKAIQPLLEIPWVYEMFPEESGQIDGTTQHSLERIFGALPHALGFEHAVYSVSENRFKKA